MKYIQRKGYRIKSSRFSSATIFCDINDQAWEYHFIYNDNSYTIGYWGIPDWNEEGKLQNKFGCSSNSIRIRSVRAFRRRLKQWSSQLPKGTKIYLCSRYRNHDVIGVIR